jgi:DNA recombination protein RmuC
MDIVLALITNNSAVFALFTVLIFFILILAVILQQWASSTQLQALYSKQQEQFITNEQLLKQLTINTSNQQASQQQMTQMAQQNLLQFEQLKRYFEQQIADFRLKILRQHAEQGEKLSSQFSSFNQQINQLLNEHQEKFSKNQLSAVDQLVDHLSKSTQQSREELTKALQMNSETLAKRFDGLTESTDLRLKDISGQVEKRLADGFEKTTKTFNDILQRLALIDDAQKKITELSNNVVSLQEVLSDKRSRGAFGEVQLNSLIRNVLPENQFAIQHTLSNGKIADCILFLPAPTGNVVIDSKFPLESYKVMMDDEQGAFERKSAQRQFKVDIKKHIVDISEKYLIEGETSDGAVMFIPAEAIFAEIHAHHSDLVELAHQKRVWLASPTTLMAILTTVRSVLKDEATRQQVHIIQAHLAGLSSDFGRFRHRFDNLAKHIDQAASDVKQIHTSAHKISDRFDKIEQVELDDTALEQKTLTQSTMSKITDNKKSKTVKIVD